MQCIRKKRTNCIPATLSYFELHCVTLVHSPLNANAQGCIKNNEPLSSNSRASFFFYYSLKNIYLHLKNQAQFQRSEIPKMFVRYRHERVWFEWWNSFACLHDHSKTKNIDQLKLMAISTSSLLSARPGSDDLHNLLLLAYYSFNLFLSLLSNKISPLRNCLGVFILVSYVHQKVSSQQRKRGK